MTLGPLLTSIVVDRLCGCLDSRHYSDTCLTCYYAAYRLLMVQYILEQTAGCMRHDHGISANGLPCHLKLLTKPLVLCGCSPLTLVVSQEYQQKNKAHLEVRYKADKLTFWPCTLRAMRHIFIPSMPSITDAGKCCCRPPDCCLKPAIVRLLRLPFNML